MHRPLKLKTSIPGRSILETSFTHIPTGWTERLGTLPFVEGVTAHDHVYWIVFTAFALISLMFLIMVRVSDPLLPRAIFGVLNTLLYFSSGAVYPTRLTPERLLDIAEHIARFSLGGIAAAKA